MTGVGEHRNGFSCGDTEDRIDDLERELGAAYLSLGRIETWIGRVLERPGGTLSGHTDPWISDLIAIAEDCRREAAEKTRVG